MSKKVLDAGETIGKITKMQMGVKYTGVWIQESLGDVSLEHYIILTNGEVSSLRMGDKVHIKLEIFL